MRPGTKSRPAPSILGARTAFAFPFTSSSHNRFISFSHTILGWSFNRRDARLPNPSGKTPPETLRAQLALSSGFYCAHTNKFRFDSFTNHYTASSSNLQSSWKNFENLFHFLSKWTKRVISQFLPNHLSSAHQQAHSPVTKLLNDFSKSPNIYKMCLFNKWWCLAVVASDGDRIYT